jgi:hypothetical protein
MNLHPCINRYHIIPFTNPVVQNKHLKRLTYSANHIPHKWDPFIQNAKLPITQRNQYISRRRPNRRQQHPPSLRLFTEKVAFWSYLHTQKSEIQSVVSFHLCVGHCQVTDNDELLFGVIMSASLFTLTGPLKSKF